MGELAVGFLSTMAIFFLTLLFALPLGLVIAFGSMSKFKPLKYFIKGFVWIIRGSPLMLQIIIIFYIPPLLFNWNFLDRFPAVIVAFTINYACYFSEIYRGGIESISKGQYEAGYVLGMTKRQVFFKVILLQLIKRVVPPMSNEIITLVKDTSLARIISVVEIIKVSQDMQKLTASILPLFYAGIFYLAFNGLLTLLFAYIEKKLNYFKA